MLIIFLNKWVLYPFQKEQLIAENKALKEALTARREAQQPAYVPKPLELSDEDKETYEATFSKDGELPERINASALNEWLFNEDTIRQVLHILMTNGLKIDYGEKLGKRYNLRLYALNRPGDNARHSVQLLS